MTEFTDTIRTTSRQPDGKGAARKLRAAGRVPVVAYGPSSEPQHFALDPHEFVLQRRKYGRSHLYDVAVDGVTKFKAFIRDIQIHPVKRHVLHVDLYAADLTKELRVSVRIDLSGKPRGVAEGGVLAQVLRRIVVEGLPERIPDCIVCDVSNLGLNQSFKVSDLPLPQGVVAVTRGDEPVATVTEPEGDKEDEKAADAAEAGADDGTAPAGGEA